MSMKIRSKTFNWLVILIKSVLSTTDLINLPCDYESPLPIDELFAESFEIMDNILWENEFNQNYPNLDGKVINTNVNNVSSADSISTTHTVDPIDFIWESNNKDPLKNINDELSGPDMHSLEDSLDSIIPFDPLKSTKDEYVDPTELLGLLSQRPSDIKRHDSIQDAVSAIVVPNPRIIVRKSPYFLQQITDFPSPAKISEIRTKIKKYYDESSRSSACKPCDDGQRVKRMKFGRKCKAFDEPDNDYLTVTAGEIMELAIERELAPKSCTFINVDNEYAEDSEFLIRNKLLKPVKTASEEKERR